MLIVAHRIAELHAFWHMLTSGRTVDTPTEQLFKRAAVARAYKYFASRLLHHNPTTAVSACRALQSCPALDLPAFLTLSLQTAAVAPYRLLHTSHITVQVMNESALPAQLQARLVGVLSECHQLPVTLCATFCADRLLHILLLGTMSLPIFHPSQTAEVCLPASQQQAAAVAAGSSTCASASARQHQQD